MHTKYADIRKIFMNALKLRGKVSCARFICAKMMRGFEFLMRESRKLNKFKYN